MPPMERYKESCRPEIRSVRIPVVISRDAVTQWEAGAGL